MLRTTDWRAGFAALAIFVGTAGCRARPPPLDSFEVKLDATPKKGAPSTPPDPVLRPWRVWIVQQYPLQKKTPHWETFAARDGRLLDLAPDGNWRCLVTPVRLLGKINDHQRVGTWIATRAVRCSSDGWRTSAEARVRAAFDPDGVPGPLDPSAPLFLNDVVNGEPRLTIVVLEGAKPARQPED